MSSELFGILFKQKLSKELVEIETKRRMVLKKSVIFVSGGIVIFLSCQIFNQFLGLAVIPFMFISIFLIWQVFVEIAKWMEEFKKQVIPKVLSILDPNLELQDSNKLDKNIVSQSRLFQGYFTSNEVFCDNSILSNIINKSKLIQSSLALNEIFCDDYITSKAYGNLKIAELKIIRGTGKNSVQVFGGVLFAAKFPIQFQGQSFAFQKSFTEPRDLEGLEKVILESPMLMEKFNFWTTNQVEARMCFQTDIMSNLLDLCEQYGTNFDLSFIDNTIYIALHQNSGFFEPNIFQSVLDPKIYQKFYDEITTLNQIITKFKLHQNL